MTMVEKVARAIMAAMMNHDGVDEGMLAVYMIEPEADQARVMARAAIEAMREPTPTMSLKFRQPPGYASRDNCIVRFNAGYQAMIDAALTEEVG